MSPAEMDRHIARTLTEVLKERLIELESLVAAGQASEDTMRRLDFVRMLLRKFESEAPEPEETPNDSKT